MYSLENKSWKITNFGVTLELSSKRMNTTVHSRGTMYYRGSVATIAPAQYISIFFVEDIKCWTACRIYHYEWSFESWTLCDFYFYFISSNSELYTCITAVSTLDVWCTQHRCFIDAKAQRSLNMGTIMGQLPVREGWHAEFWSGCTYIFVLHILLASRKPLKHYIIELSEICRRRNSGMTYPSTLKEYFSV